MHTQYCAGCFNINMFNKDSYERRVLSDATLETFSLTQMVSSPTSLTETSKTLIDLLLVTKPDNVLFTGVCDAPGISDHCFTYFVYNIKKEKFMPYSVFKKKGFINFDKNKI